MVSVRYRCAFPQQRRPKIEFVNCQRNSRESVRRVKKMNNRKLSGNKVNRGKTHGGGGMEKQQDLSLGSMRRLLSIPDHRRTKTNEAREEHAN